MSWRRALFNTADAYGKPRETAKDSLKLPKFLSSRLLALFIMTVSFTHRYLIS